LDLPSYVHSARCQVDITPLETDHFATTQTRERANPEGPGYRFGQRRKDPLNVAQALKEWRFSRVGRRPAQTPRRARQGSDGVSLQGRRGAGQFRSRT
jgi:hypothetical protein